MKKMQYVVMFLFIAFLIMSVQACDGQRPIKIGFVAGLTGKHSELGTSGRNGVILAVEERNRQDGINGRKIELSIKDDKQNEEQAIAVVRELIDERVTAIIGHMTSQMTIQTVPMVTQEKMLMISPTAATNALIGIDDFFIRVCMPTKNQIDKFVYFAINEIDLATIAVIYDTSNEAYTSDYYSGFVQAYKEQNKGPVTAVPFNAMGDFSFNDIAKKIVDLNPDGVLIASSSLDAALLCQNIRKNNYTGAILSSAWGMTNDFIKHGGRYVEGVYFVHWFYSTSPEAVFRRVKNDYYERFGEEFDFAASMAYEAAQLLFSSLERATTGPEIKKTILVQGGFDGLQGKVTIDSFGDPDRQTYLLVVKDSQILEAL